MIYQSNWITLMTAIANLILLNMQKNPSKLNAQKTVTITAIIFKALAVSVVFEETEASYED